MGASTGADFIKKDFNTQFIGQHVVNKHGPSFHDILHLIFVSPQALPLTAKMTSLLEVRCMQVSQIFFLELDKFSN